MAGGETLEIDGDTTGATDKFPDDRTGLDGSNCAGGTYAGPDLVYAVTPIDSGQLTATLNATFDDPYIHVRTACPGTASDEVACEWAGSGPVEVTFAVVGGTTYFVVPDGWGGEDVVGPFSLSLSLQ